MTSATPFPAARERELVAATETGDPAATSQLVDGFLPAIDGVARLYRGFSWLEEAELRQEGVVGLLKAAKRYDESFGTPFWSYASWWVRQAMQQSVSELTGPVVLSDRAARCLARLKKARQAYQQAHRREPSVAELAEVANLPRRQVERLTAVERAPRRLDERLPDEDASATPLVECLADPAAEDAYERVGDAIEAERVVKLTEWLDDRERGIVFAHYGIGCRQLTLREIAGGLDLSVERVRQLEELALRKLRQAIAYPDNCRAASAATSGSTVTS